MLAHLSLNAGIALPTEPMIVVQPGRLPSLQLTFFLNAMNKSPTAGVVIACPIERLFFPCWTTGQRFKDPVHPRTFTRPAFEKVAKLAVEGASKGPLVTLGLETLLRAAQPLVAKPIDRSRDALLTGNMASYSWEVQNGDIHSIKTGERIEITMLNLSMMTHPMHLHGHHFQVVGIDGTPIQGAVRDTVAVPPMSTVTIAFDANNPGRWAFHCHHLYHMAAGMMTFVAYNA